MTLKLCVHIHDAHHLNLLKFICMHELASMSAIVVYMLLKNDDAIFFDMLKIHIENKLSI